MATAAEQAVEHILHRVQTDPRLAYYIGPATESLELLITAYAEMKGNDREQLKASILSQLKFEEPPEPNEGQGDVTVITEYIAGEIYSELMYTKHRLYIETDAQEKAKLGGYRDGLQFGIDCVGTDS